MDVQSSEGGDMDLTEPESNPESPADLRFHHKLLPDKVKFYTYGHRRMRQKVVSNYSTVTKGASPSAKPRAALKQVFLNQGPSDKNLTAEEKNQLETLKLELEAFAVPVSLKWRWAEEKGGSSLERHWTDIVNSHSSMSRMQKHQQEAMWEFIATELNYINQLTIIKDLVIAALVNVRFRGFLDEVTPELLFSNLSEILSAHQLFWQEVIFPMLELLRSTGRPFCPLQMEAGFLQFSEHLTPYLHYCAQQENSLEFSRQQMESNPQFATYVQWVETHPQCSRMRIGDMQAKPHQRITKYSLLLKALLKTTQDPRVQLGLRGMLCSMNGFLVSINEYLRLKDQDAALAISAQRLDGYEVEGINEEIDKHVQDICQFDLTSPMRGVGRGVVRKLLLEENLKIRGRKDSKLEVVALLFSDVFLVTKVQKKGERLKVLRPPLALDRTHCIPLKDNCSFLLVEVGELRCPVNVDMFTASTCESCSNWVSTIHQAKVTLRNLRQANRRSAKVEEMHGTDSHQGKRAACELLVSHLVNGVNAPKDNHKVAIQRLAIKDNGLGMDPEGERNPAFANAQIQMEQSVASVKIDQDSRSPNNLVPGGYPDVDYPTGEENPLRVPGQTRASQAKNQSPPKLKFQPETNRFAEILKAPILKRNGHQTLCVPTAPNSRGSQSNTSSSNSDSECSLDTKNSSIVLKLSALKPTKGTFWGEDPGASSDAGLFSEPGRTRLKSEAKRFQASPATMENLLERSRVREAKSPQAAQMKLTASPPTSSSPSPSEDDRDELWSSIEAPSVSHGWREQLVDSDSEEPDSLPFTNGINVDLARWCVQDEEVMEYDNPETRSLLEHINHALTLWNQSEQEDFYYNEV
ncbi:pleckstrin homology domain-containing family G member 5 isoform X2 [Stigmatopora argus]